MKTVHEVSELSGVSVRTLHHYDAIGLLKPSAFSEAGYRLYDDAAIGRLQSILLFRELQFPLKEIREILEAPGFDVRQAYRQQHELLKMRKERLEGLMGLLEKLMEKGENAMDFSAFDEKKIIAYQQEAKEKWGDTEAYRESEKMRQGCSPADESALAKGMMDIFRKMGQIRHLPPEGEEGQALAGELRQYITDHYYPCTKEIFLSLGQMYTQDDRFLKNIDEAGGEGTAAFAGQAIACYCGQE